MTRISTTRCLNLLWVLVPACALSATQAAPPQQQVSIPAPSAVNGAPPPADEAAAALEALEGFCVVTLRDRQQWIEGNRQIGAIFDGRAYYFASPRQREIFAAAPQKYAPVLRGDCPVVFQNTGVRTPGKIEFAALVGNRVALFSSADALANFRKNPKRYANVDLACGGICLVSRVDHDRQVAGMSAAEAIKGGLRYRFIDANARALFLKNPDRYIALASRYFGNENYLTTPSDETESIGPPEAAAMDGYCPVSLKLRGLWIRGRTNNRFDFEDRYFLAAGPTERSLLESDPGKYLPALGGDCVVTLADHGQRVRGSIYNAVEYKDRLYLLAGPNEQQAFQENPGKYTAIGEDRNSD